MTLVCQSRQYHPKNTFKHCCNSTSVTFFYFEGQKRHYKIHLKMFQNIFMFFIEIYWRHQFVRSFMANHCRTKISSSSPSLPKYWSKTTHGSSPDTKPVSGIDQFVWQGLRASALPLSLNVIMLYGNVEQLTKLHVSIFALLAWTNYGSEFIIKNIKNALKFAKYLKFHLKMHILN
jgi:hypothetical protein